MLRYLSKPAFKTSVVRNAATAVKPTSDYVPSDTSTRNWLTRLGEISNTPDSKSYLGQLTTIVNLFNRKAADPPQVTQHLSRISNGPNGKTEYKPRV